MGQFMERVTEFFRNLSTGDPASGPAPTVLFLILLAIAVIGLAISIKRIRKEGIKPLPTGQPLPGSPAMEEEVIKKLDRIFTTLGSSQQEPTVPAETDEPKEDKKEKAAMPGPAPPKKQPARRGCLFRVSSIFAKAVKGLKRKLTRRGRSVAGPVTIPVHSPPQAALEDPDHGRSQSELRESGLGGDARIRPQPPRQGRTGPGGVLPAQPVGSHRRAAAGDAGTGDPRAQRPSPYAAGQRADDLVERITAQPDQTEEPVMPVQNCPTQPTTGCGFTADSADVSAWTTHFTVAHTAFQFRSLRGKTLEEAETYLTNHSRNLTGWSFNSTDTSVLPGQVSAAKRDPADPNGVILELRADGHHRRSSGWLHKRIL